MLSNPHVEVVARQYLECREITHQKVDVRVDSTQPDPNRFESTHFLLFMVNTITLSLLQHVLTIPSMKFWILDIVVVAILDSDSINQSKFPIRIIDFIVVSVNRNFRSEKEEGEEEAEVEVSIEGRVNDTINGGGAELDESGGMGLFSGREGEEGELIFLNNLKNKK